MSSIVNKVKEALHSDKDKTTHEGTHSSTHPTTHTGTHTGTHTTSSAADPRAHTTHGTTTTGHGVGGTTGVGSDNYAVGGANRGASGPASNTDGPHNSNLLNKADPRIDSDRDHSKNLGMNPQGTATTGTGATKDHPGHTVRGNEAGFAGTTTGTGLGGAQHHSGVAGTTAGTHTDGPHGSNILNKADPRVDSDRDHSRNMGMNPHGTATTGTTGTTGTFGTTGHTGGIGSTGHHDGSTIGNTGIDSTTGHTGGIGHAGGSTIGNTGLGSAGHTGHTGGIGSTGHTGGIGSTGTTGGIGSTGLNRGTDGPATRTDGPHGSNVLNKADPRVDSDRDHSRNMGANPHGNAATGTGDNSAFFSSGTTGTTGTHGTHTGTHGTHTGPTTGTTGTHGTHNTLAGATGSGPGPAPNTAGPHKSDMLNKADPRVDSNLDGSKTIGGNKTYAQS